MKKHPLDLQDGISHQYKGQGLNGRNGKEYKNLRIKVTQAAEVQKGFPFHNSAILDNLLGTYHQSVEEGNNDPHKYKGWQILIVAKNIGPGLGNITGIPGEPCHDQCKQRSLQKIEQHELSVGQFGKHIPLGKNPELLESTRYLKIQFWQWLLFGPDLLLRFDSLQIDVVPFLGGHFALTGYLPIFIHLSGLHHLQYLLRHYIATGDTVSHLGIYIIA